MADPAPPIFLASLCTGGGRLDEGLRRAVFPSPVVPLLSVEIEAFAGAYLVGEMEEERLAPHPLWSDLAEIPDRTLDVLRSVGEEHCLAVTAGFPCTPWSTAGQRKGIEDERWIWHHIARILRHLRPALVVLECTPGVTAGGLARVLGTLAEIGLDAEWDCVRASDVGAPHQRARWWCVGASERFIGLLGHGDGQGCEGREQHQDQGQAGSAAGGEELADGDSGGQPGQRRQERHGDRQDPRRHDPSRRLPRFPPRRSGDEEAWRRILADRPELAPALTRADEPAAVRALRSMAHGLVAPERTDMLRLLGNGVVPQCAAATIYELLARLTRPE